MRRTLLALAMTAAAWFGAAAEGWTGETLWYSPPAGGGYSVVTAYPGLPLLLYLEDRFGIADIRPAEPLPDGVVAKIVYANGGVMEIGGTPPAGGFRLRPSQEEIHEPVADDCETAREGGVYAITAADLPYTGTFDVSAAADSGDFRGSAADSISRPGGHDGFWTFAPDAAGAYRFSLSALKASSSPIPGHDFELERGFGGIGVWEGECGSLSETGTANSIVGDSVLVAHLEAGTVYTVVWEDFFVGSTESRVTLSIESLGEPEGDEITSAVNLSDLGWGFEIEADTAANRNLADGDCIETEDGDGHGAGTGDVSGNDAWFRLPAAEPGAEYTVTAAPADGPNPVADTVISLHAYNLATHEVSPVSCVDDTDDGDRMAPLTFTAEAGRIYYVMVETKPGFDQLPFGQFALKGIAGPVAGVGGWTLHE